MVCVRGIKRFLASLLRVFCLSCLISCRIIIAFTTGSLSSSSVRINFSLSITSTNPKFYERSQKQGNLCVMTDIKLKRARCVELIGRTRSDGDNEITADSLSPRQSHLKAMKKGETDSTNERLSRSQKCCL